MGNVILEESSLSDIGDAIRSKLGVETTYLPREMAAAIESISVTDLTSADEGKVVVESSGEYVLQAQTSRTITQNGTYDTTTNDEVVVSVSGGGGPSETQIDKILIGSFNPSATTRTAIACGYRFTPTVDLRVDKLIVFPRSSSVSVHISNASTGAAVYEAFDVSVVADGWRDIEITPTWLSAGTEYVVWFDEGGTGLSAITNAATITAAPYVTSATNVYATSITMPTATESNAAYGINVHFSAVRISGGTTNIMSGTDAPTASDGSDGDIYILYAQEGVRNSNGQYISTGYSGDSGSKYVIDFMLAASQVGQYPTPFGGRSQSNSVTDASNVHILNTSTMIGWGSSQSTAFNVGYSSMIGKLSHIELEAGTALMRVGADEYRYTFTPTSINATTNIGIFALLAGNSAVKTCMANDMVLYGFAIYENDTLVHRFVPAIDDNDTVCVYDEVANEYKYHSGGGTLTYVNGDTIIETYLKVNGSWVPIDGQDIDDVNTQGGGRLYTNVTLGANVLITDVSEFTKLYSTSIPYGEHGAKVGARLAVTDESAISNLMTDGWSANGASYYDEENQTGAYAGYDFGMAIRVSKVKFWIGRYSYQNITLIATVQYLDANGDWNDVEDLSVTGALPYPTNVFEVEIDAGTDIYGIRWIHKKGPAKSGGNNICFFGMTVYRDLGRTVDVYRPSSSGLIEPPSGYDGFGPLYIQ